MPKVRISRLQLITMLACLVFGKAIGYTSGLMARTVESDAWLSMIFSFVWGMLLIALVAWIAARMGGAELHVYLPRLLGRPLSATVLLLLSLWFFVAYMTGAITITQHVNDYLMTETPVIVFVLATSIICLYAAYLGIEVLGRLSVLGLALTALLNLLMVAGSVQRLDFTRLLPLFDSGFLPVLAASSYGLTDVAMAVLSALMLLPMTGKPARWVRLGWWGMGIGAVLVVTWPIFELGVLSSRVTAQYLIACMQMARASELGIWLHRYELVMALLFVYSTITQASVCLYCATELLREATPLKRVPRPWVMTGAVLLTIPVRYALAYDRETYSQFLGVPWTLVCTGTVIGVPLLLAAVALLRGPKAASTGRAVPPQ